MSVVCNGSTYPVTLAQVGADRGSAPTGGDDQTRAGYAGSITITGLVEGVSYPYTVTQGTNSRSGTLSKFWATTPADFSFFIVACDRPGAVDVTLGDDANLYGVIRDYVVNGALPCVGYMHSDDIGYADMASVDDRAYSGKQQVCNETAESIQTYITTQAPKGYDFALVHLAYLGLLGNITDPDIAFGQNEARVWCRENLAFYPQWGNHEFGTVYGVPTTWPAYGTPFHATDPATGGWDGVGITTWNALFGPIVPTTVRDTDAHSNPWAITIGGAIKVCALDFLSNKTQVASVVYGNAQIDDVLAAVDSVEPFKLLMLPTQIRAIHAGDTGGSAGNLETQAASEVSRLLTATTGTQQSVMRNPKTNGVQGVSVCVHGDYHHAYVSSHRKPADGSNHAELLYSINSATVNGSSGHTFDQTLSVVANETLYYGEDYANQPHIVRVDVYGSRSRPEMHITLINHNGIAWSGKWYAKSSNEAFDVDHTMGYLVGTSKSVSQK